MGIVADDAVVDDLVIVAEGATVGGREILLYDEIARPLRPARVLRPCAAFSSSAASRFGRLVI
jgi:hypothetical protein